MSNKLLDNLQFKSLTLPTWFGRTREDVQLMQESVWEFLETTVIPEIIEKLLDLEPSLDYWYQADVWPYPDVDYLHTLCNIIDTTAPDDFDLHIRTFYLGYLLKHIQAETWRLLPIVHTERLKQQ